MRPEKEFKTVEIEKPEDEFEALEKEIRAVVKKSIEGIEMFLKNLEAAKKKKIYATVDDWISNEEYEKLLRTVRFVESIDDMINALDTIIKGKTSQFTSLVEYIGADKYGDFEVIKGGTEKLLDNLEKYKNEKIEELREKKQEISKVFNGISKDIVASKKIENLRERMDDLYARVGGLKTLLANFLKVLINLPSIWRIRSRLQKLKVKYGDDYIRAANIGYLSHEESQLVDPTALAIIKEVQGLEVELHKIERKMNKILESKIEVEEDEEYYHEPPPSKEQVPI